MNPRLFGDDVVLRLGAFPVTVTMLSTLLVDVVLVSAFFFLGRAVRSRQPGNLAALARLFHRFVSELVAQAYGKPRPLLEAFAGGLFSFILASAIVGQLPHVAAPTSNLAVSSALATVVFVAVPVVGIEAQGLRGYLKHYLAPNPLLMPLHVVSELSRTVALSLRLFGNMMSGHLVVALLVALVGFLVPVPLMALDLLIGALQAYIFTILTCVYLGAAARVGESE